MESEKRGTASSCLLYLISFTSLLQSVLHHFKYFLGFIDVKVILGESFCSNITNACIYHCICKTWAIKVSQPPEKHTAKCIWFTLENMKYILYFRPDCSGPSDYSYFYMIVDAWLSDSDIKCMHFL